MLKNSKHNSILLFACLVLTGCSDNMDSTREFKSKNGIVLKLFERHQDLTTRPWWGNSGTKPIKVIVGMEIIVRGKKIITPLSAYSDLSQVRNVSFSEVSKDENKITIDGGDDSEGFSCILHLNKGEFVNRKVSSSTFPTNFFEVTTYTNLAVED